MNFKKMLSLFLILTLVLGSMGSAFAAPINIVGDVVLPEGDLFLGTSIKQDAKASELSRDDLVRIVVEMETPNVVSQVGSSGMNYQNISKNEINSMSEVLYNEQQILKNDIIQNNISIQYHYDFVQVFNGFSATTTYGDALAIEEMPNVKRVTLAIEYERPTPQMSSSHDIIESELAWTNGFDGEGMVVAVLDTGVDPSHQDMKLSAETEVKIIQSDLSGIDGLAPGKWFTKKVPFGYNYMDKNQEILDLGPEASMHGMHVTGSVAANGLIKGVAPEAQILAMKVFGNDPKFGSTYGDIYVRAIEDSVRLGADVINMSLGSTASFVIEEENDPARVAIREATEAGLIVSVSAGNSAHFGNGHANPLASNPDIGLVGSPSLNPETVSVASIENLNTVAVALSHNEEMYPYILSGDIDPVVQFSGEVEYAFAGLGSEEDVASVDLDGKIALIQRGAFNFSTKILNAQAAGAIGVIVFNSEAGGNEIMGMSYGDDASSINVPAVFIGIDNGLALKGSDNKNVSFNGQEVNAPNPNAGKMSAFTSWGTTSNLDFKPEITAPGGQIYSTLQNNDYGMMSGTSMAAPHVAGGSAVVLQRINEDFPTLSPGEKSILAKNILMNTAKPLIDRALYNNHFSLGNYVSPRRHGAGVMNLSGATTTDVVVTSPEDDNLAKVNLKEMGDVTTFPLELKNLGDTDITYNISGTVTTDMISGGNNLLEANGVFKPGTLSEEAPWVGEFPISFTQGEDEVTSIIVPAGQTVSINGTIDLTGAIDWMYNAPLMAIFPNGTFIEGFVILEDEADQAAELSVPYVGFYGEWDKAPVIDTVSYDGTGFYGNLTVLTHLDDDTFSFLGTNPEDGSLDDEYIYISSQGNGLDHARALMTFLRNAKTVKIEILDENGQVVRNVAESNYVRKNYYDRGLASRYNALESWAWDGKIDGIPAKDGQYYYKVTAVIDYPDATPQEVIFPVKVDSNLPVITSFEMDTETSLLSVEADDDIGIWYYRYEIKKDGEVIADIETEEDFLDVSTLETGAYEVEVFAYDYAKNYSKSDPILFGDGIVPTINMISPEPYEVFDNTMTSVVVEGNVADASSVENFKIIHTDSEGSETEYDLALDEENNFSLTLEDLADGLHTLRPSASDELSNSINFTRTFYVDKTPAVITLTTGSAITTSPSAITTSPGAITTTSGAITVSGDVETYNLVGTIVDNFPSLEVKINGNYVYSVSGSDSTNESIDLGANYDLNEILALNYGANNFLIEVKDYAGNITTKNVKIVRGSEDLDIDIVIDSPKALLKIGGSEVEVSAVVTNNSISPIQKISATIDSKIKEIDLTTMENQVINIEEKFEAISDGVHYLTIEAELENGNIFEVKRKIFIDNTNPEIEIQGIDNNTITVDHTIETIDCTINATDNSQGLNILIDDTLVAKTPTTKWLSVESYVPSMLSYKTTFELDYGVNTFIIQSLDEMGNVTSQEITITRESAPEEPTPEEPTPEEPTPSNPTPTPSPSQPEDEDEDEDEDEPDLDSEDELVTEVISVEVKSKQTEKIDEEGEAITEVVLNANDVKIALADKNSNTVAIKVEENNNKKVEVTLTNNLLVQDGKTKKAIEVQSNNLVMLIQPNAFELEDGDEVILSIEENESLKTASNSNNLSKDYDFNFVSKKTGLKITFDKPVQVKVPYQYKEGVNTSRLGLYRYNEEDKAWIYVGGKVDTENNVVTAQLNQFSRYKVMEYTKEFKDFNENHWAYKEAEVMIGRHIIKGMTETSFEPNSDLTVAQFVALIVRSTELELGDAEVKIRNLEEDQWYFKAVNIAASHGIIDNSGLFLADVNITREQMALIVSNTLKVLGYEPKLAHSIPLEKYDDVELITPDSQKAIAFVTEVEIFNGKGSGFDPIGNATRAEATAVIYRIMKYLDML